MSFNSHDEHVWADVELDAMPDLCVNKSNSFTGGDGAMHERRC